MTDATDPDRLQRRAGGGGEPPSRVTSRRRLLTTLPRWIVLAAAFGCVSVHRSATGYERRGVWGLKRRERARYRGQSTLVLDGHELQFDGSLGVYRVAGRDRCFYLGGWFYRQREGAWARARAVDGPWTKSEERALPPGLRDLAHG
jgi:hypothetical protein